MRKVRPKHSELTSEQRLKLNCRSYTHVLIKRGKLTKGLCIVCSSKETEAHHEDYTDPRSVTWFCRNHHLEYHKQKNEVNK